MNKPKVGIIMGSDSDLSIMQECAMVLEEFSIEYEMIISSAHRSPEKTAVYAKEAAAEGKKVLIVGAGAAAHLPGIIASFTVLPVIGIPIRTPALGGIDSLYSIVQMPRGIPVATVAINGAFNAGILAVEILGVTDKNIRQKLIDYKIKLATEVESKNKRLNEVGYRNYLKEKQL